MYQWEPLETREKPTVTDAELSRAMLTCRNVSRLRSGPLYVRSRCPTWIPPSGPLTCPQSGPPGPACRPASCAD